MKVFISWSGAQSKAVAEFLRDWLSCVIQSTRPWISTRDLDRGSKWFSEINDQLRDTSVGIVCLTPENRNRPWILFEAGALAKGLSSSRVCTFLIDLKSSDIEDPLAQFNHTLPEKESVYSLVQTLNNALGSNGLDAHTLDEVFEVYWPRFESGFQKALKKSPAEKAPEPRDPKDILAEILENTRQLASRVGRLEEKTSRPVMLPLKKFAVDANDLGSWDSNGPVSADRYPNGPTGPLAYYHQDPSSYRTDLGPTGPSSYYPIDTRSGSSGPTGPT